MKDKRILILVMSCNKEFFNQLLKNLRENLYAKDILNKLFDNVDFWSYSASYDNNFHINKKIHHMYIPCADDLEHTYEKTYKALKFIKELDILFDYILRTNTSSYVNVRLLQQYVKSANPDLVHTGAIYCSADGTGPYNWCFYGVGNALLLSNKWVDIIINNPVTNFKDTNTVKTDNDHLFKIDDNAIGLVVNSYAFGNNIDMYSVWKNFNLPSVNTIPDNPEKYIVIPYREYNTTNIRDNETNNAVSIHNKIKFFYQTNKNIQYVLSTPVVHILDFSRGLHSVVSYEFIQQFLDVMSLPRYIKKLKQQRKI